MTRTPVGQHLYIESEPTRWRMIAPASVTRTGDVAIIEAGTGGPLRYVPAFGTSRRLPVDAALASAQIQRIVVGWSRRDASWHLGLMLPPELAASRANIRWVEIASWREIDSMQAAVGVGEGLARVLAVPFSILPPKDDSGIITPIMPAASAAAAAPAAAPSPWAAPTAPGTVTPAPLAAVAPASLSPWAAPVQPGIGSASFAAPLAPPLAPEPLPRPLPIHADKWTLAQIAPSILELRRRGSVRGGAFVRALWYVLWALIFGVLSATSLTSGIAPPQPEFLPYIGFGCAVLLLILALRSLWQTRGHINRIVADGTRREIVGLYGDKARWVLPAEAMDAVYISERVTKVRARSTRRTIQQGELNFLMHDLKFWHGAVFGRLDEKIPVIIPEGGAEAVVAALNSDAVVLLDGHNALTDARQIGLHMARTVGVPAHYDPRIK